MDFQKIVDGMAAMTAIISIEDLGDGKYGKIRIVTGNRAYLDSIEKPVEGVEMNLSKFVPDTEYTDYLPRDLNFEDFCYRAAVEKKCLHSYAHPERFNVWFNMTFLPVAAEKGNLRYCTYTMEINPVADTDLLSNVSGDIAARVLSTGLKMRGASDFRGVMQDVIKDIRELCYAEHCCILLLNAEKQTCSVLCEDFREGSQLQPMEQNLDQNFYALAETWEDTISGSNCLIAKNEHDMEVVKERNPVWYESIISGGVHNIILFPLKAHEELLGYIWASNFEQDKAVNIKETLELTSFILGSEIGNYMLLDMLRSLSSRDSLTGLLNHNALTDLMEELKKQDAGSVSIVFADLNGLKRVNDTEGHVAGNRLLKSTANALRQAFGQDEYIFRVGGDEFIVIMPDRTEPEMDAGIKELRRLCREHGSISLAIGSCVAPRSDVKDALRIADARMYEDKARYYRENPDKKRKEE